jgi:hypothetical protein
MLDPQAWVSRASSLASFAFMDQAFHAQTMGEFSKSKESSDEM